MTRYKTLSRRASLGMLGLIVLAPPALAGDPAGSAGSARVTRLWRVGDPGTRLHLRARVLSTSGRPLPGAVIELWQADGTGVYPPDRYRATISAGEKGLFALDTVLPGQYHGAKHIHVIVKHAGFAPLATRVLFKGDPYLPPGEQDLAILLEEVKKDGETVLVGNVELVLTPDGSA